MKYLMIFVTLVFSSDLLARLRPVPWEYLLGNSQLVVLAQVKEIKIMQGEGQAKLKVIDVAKGQYSDKFITVHWTSEVHDSKIYEANKNYVLFLKKSELGKYIGAVYGRSFWKTEFINDRNLRDKSGSKFVIKMNEFPLSGITDTPENITNLYNEESCGVLSKKQYRKIYLQPLVQYIKSNSYGSY